MKRTFWKILFVFTSVLCLFALFSTSAYAKEEGQGSSGIDDALRDFSSILPPGSEELAEEGGALDRLGLESLFDEVTAALNGSLGKVGSFFLLIFGSALLMASVNYMNDGLSTPCRVAVITVLSVGVFSGIYPPVRQAAEAMGQTSGFFASLLPIMLGVTSLGGSAGTLAVHSSSMALTLQIYSALSQSLIPLVFCIFAFGLASSAGNEGLSSLAKGIRSLFTRGMGILTALLSALLSLQTVVASAADGAVIRAAKYSASGMIPVVGGAVSGALSTLAGGLAYAKGIIGGGAVAVVVGFALSPLISLLLYKLCFFISVTFLEFCSANEGAKTLSAMSAGLDALISVYSMSTVIFLLQIILFITGGGVT